jgi:hypothetical protein
MLGMEYKTPSAKLDVSLEQYELFCKERGLEITKLQLQKIRLEALVNDFQDRNDISKS